MRERPILFSASMVRALLAGIKTQTRRVVKNEAKARALNAAGRSACPYGQPGDQLWVRETWREFGGTIRHVDYKATTDVPQPADGWKPSIHMRRADSRITLEVIAVRVERLQDISGTDCLAEGIEPSADANRNARSTLNEIAYQKLWESINGVDSWDANPWVWVIEFKRVENRG